MRQEAIDDNGESVELRRRTVRIRTATLAILQFSICVALSLAFLTDPRPTNHHVIWFLALPAFLLGGAVIGYRLFRIYRAETTVREVHLTSGWIPWTPWLFVLSAVAIPQVGLNAGNAIAGAVFVVITLALTWRSARWALQDIRLEYVAPRVTLFRAAFTGMATVRSHTPLGALSILSGMIGAVLIIMQIFIFFALWLIVEVAGPILDLVICGPFRWFAGVVSRTTSPMRRYSLAIVWAAIGAIPGLAVAIAVTWLIH